MSEYQTCVHCRRQALRVEVLEETVRQLESELYGREWLPPHELALTPAQGRLLAALVKHDRVLSDWVLFSASRGRSCSAEELHGQLISTMLCQIRKKLTPFGVEIRTIKSVGYYLPPDSRARLLSWPAQSPRAA